MKNVVTVYTNKKTSLQILGLNNGPVDYIGNPSLFKQNMLGLLCSKKCPGELILKAFDTALYLRQQNNGVISGFHSPLEKDLLPILLRGNNPVVLCLARSIVGYRIPSAYRGLVNEGRLAILSPPFARNQKRIDRHSAALRNEWIAQVCSQMLIIYAQPGGSLEKLCLRQVHSGREIFAISSQHNQHLFAAGVKVWSEDLRVNPTLKNPKTP